MIRFQILKKFLIPSSLAATVVRPESDKSTDTPAKPCRPSELPLYVEDSCGCRSSKQNSTQPETPSALEEQIRVLRKELWVWYDQYKGYREKLVEKVEIAKAHTESTLELLKEEENYLPRIGAISLGGLTGIIFGLRGGWFRRLVYGTTGSLAMSALCYPRQASEVTHEALSYAKKYVAVTYNFIYGVKPEVLNSDSPNSSDSKSRIAENDANVVKEAQERRSKPEATKNHPHDQGNPADSDLYSQRGRK